MKNYSPIITISFLAIFFGAISQGYASPDFASAPHNIRVANQFEGLFSTPSSTSVWPPINIRIKQTENSLLVTWKKPLRPVDGYRIYRSNSKKILGKIITTITNPEQTSFIDSSVQPNTRYYYTVRSFLKTGGESKNTAHISKIFKISQKTTPLPTQPSSPPLSPIIPQQSNYATDSAKFIVRIICSDGVSSNSVESQITMGSGTIFGLNKFIITNSHVVEGAALCSVGITDNIKNPPSRWYEATITSNIPSLDIAMLKPAQALPDSVSTVAYNLCTSEEIQLGDEIIILGYPGVGGNTITATEGVISGFDRFRLKTSAKIEHGNSGGGAFLKKNGCWFGIPTSVSKGELESLGSIINYSLIHEQSQ